MKPGHIESSPATGVLELAILEKMENLRQAAQNRLVEGEAIIRKEPAKAIAYAVGAGYLIGFLPLVAIARVLGSLLTAVIRPALVLYGVAKVLTLLGRTCNSQLARDSQLD